jgi:hypothetical protein
MVGLRGFLLVGAHNRQILRESPLSVKEREPKPDLTPGSVVAPGGGLPKGAPG